MILRLIVATITFSCAVAHSENLPNKDAAAISWASSMVQAGITAIAGKTAMKTELATAFSKRIVTNAIQPQKLTTANMADIKSAVEGSWFPRTGYGQVGGAEIELVYDKGQIERLAGAENAKAIDLKSETGRGASFSGSAVEVAEAAKPQMVQETVNVRLVGDQKALAEELARLAESGAVVSRVDVRTNIKGPALRASLRGISGILSIYFLATTSSNVARALDFSYKSMTGASATAAHVGNECKMTDSNDCNIPWTKSYRYLWDTADSVFYTFYADQ